MAGVGERKLHFGPCWHAAWIGANSGRSSASTRGDVAWREILSPFGVCQQRLRGDRLSLVDMVLARLPRPVIVIRS